MTTVRTTNGWPGLSSPGGQHTLVMRIFFLLPPDTYRLPAPATSRNSPRRKALQAQFPLSQGPTAMR
jgi:hypothetical protein